MFSDEDAKNVRSLERDSGISDHGLDDETEPAYEETDDYDDIDSQQFENKNALSQDLRFLFGMPELCDVMFVVGEERQAMYGVKAILAIRSRVFYKILYGPKASKPKLASDGNNSTANVGKRFLGKSGSSGDAQKRNFSLLRQSNASLRTATSFASSQADQKIIVHIEEFDPDVFKQLLEYVHTGSVVLRPKTLLGLLNAADHFALEELRRACAEYSQKCITLDTVCSLLVTAERYIQYKSSKIFVQRVLDFVDKNGDDVLQLSDFVHLPRHVVELILSRDELSASESNKFQAALRWSRHFLLYHPHDATLAQTMAPFVQYVAFQSIAAQRLMQEIRPLDVVPDRILMNALAFQADPNCVNEEMRFSVSNRSKLDVADRSPKINIDPTKNPPGSQRSRSVDRNLSNSSNHSSNCSDSGFHDDFYGTNPSETSRLNATVLQENPTEAVGQAKKFVYRRDRDSPGITVVQIESPIDDETIDRGKIENKAKSFQDLSVFSNISSVHYRF